MIPTRTLRRPLPIVALAGAAFACSAFAPAFAQDLSAVPSGTYNVDPTHAYVTFSYNHLGLSNPELSFDDFDVTLDLDGEDVTNSTVTATIQADSIVAGSDTWKDHITGADFFDTENNPEITFESTGVEEAGDGALKVDGDLTIKGETRPVSLAVTINAAMDHPMSGDPVIGLDASTTVLRSDFGLDKFAPAVSDEVTIAISAEMVKAE